MNAASIYLTVLIMAGLAIVLDQVFVNGKTNKGISRRAGLALAFVMAGIFLCGPGLMGYGLFGAGIMLAIIDIIRNAGTKVSS